MTPTERRLGHVPGLDGVRGIAVLAVVGLHAGIALVPSRFNGVLPGGLVGVDLFFVLSGFLITSLLVSERAERGTISFGAFYTRRALRLLPALTALMAASVVWTFVSGLSLREEARGLWPIALYVSNWTRSFSGRAVVPAGMGQTWTLSVEEQFYLVWPALLLGLLALARRRRMIVTTLSVAIVLSAVIRAWIWAYGAGYPSAYMRTDARADGLLIGALAAFLWRWELLPKRWVHAVAWATLVGLAAMLPGWNATSPGMFYGGFTIAAVGFAAVIISVANGTWRATRWFEHRSLRAIGRVSYGLYLWHPFLLTVVVTELPDLPRPVLVVIGLAASAAATAASWYVIERPFLDLKRRWSRTIPVPTLSGDAPLALAD